MNMKYVMKEQISQFLARLDAFIASSYRPRFQFSSTCKNKCEILNFKLGQNNKCANMQLSPDQFGVRDNTGVTEVKKVNASSPTDYMACIYIRQIPSIKSIGLRIYVGNLGSHEFKKVIFIKNNYVTLPCLHSMTPGIIHVHQLETRYPMYWVRG